MTPFVLITTPLSLSTVWRISHPRCLPTAPVWFTENLTIYISLPGLTYLSLLLTPNCACMVYCEPHLFLSPYRGWRIFNHRWLPTAPVWFTGNLPNYISLPGVTYLSPPLTPNCACVIYCTSHYFYLPTGFDVSLTSVDSQLRLCGLLRISLFLSPYRV